MLNYFVIGLAASVGHCFGMCGPLAVLINRSYYRFFLTNVGRLFTYSLLGALSAGLGSKLNSSTQAIVSIAAGCIAIYTALSFLGKVPPLENLFSRLLPFWNRSMRSVLKIKYQELRWILWGIAWGTLPCGLVITMLTTAASYNSAFKGASILFSFGLGTVPILAITFHLGRKIKPFNKITALAMTILGLQLLLRGLAIWDLIDHMKLGPIMLW